MQDKREAEKALSLHGQYPDIFTHPDLPKGSKLLRVI